MKERIYFLHEILGHVERGLWWSDQQYARDHYLSKVGLEQHAGAFEKAILSDCLNSARAIHDSVIPHRFWEIHEGVAYTHTKETEYATSGQVSEPRPATAWVIAILKAMIEEEEEIPE